MFEPVLPGRIDMPSTLNTPEDLTYPTPPAILGEPSDYTVTGNETRLTVIGAEYAFLKKLDKKKQSPFSKHRIPQELIDGEIEYVYRNRKGKLIYTPMYEAYRDTFKDAILEKGSRIAGQVKTSFADFHNTSTFERYQLNSAQFSAAKNMAETKLMQQAVIGDDGAVKGFSEFKRDANQIAQVTNDTWLRTEYDSARGNIVSIDSWSEILDSKEIYPTWTYFGVMDSRERQQHVDLEGKVFLIGDPEGDAAYPPAGWSCRCHGEPSDDTPVTNAKALLERNVDKQFRYNAYNQGILPNIGSYFDVSGSANEVKGNQYSGVQAVKNSARALYRAKGMHFLLEQIEQFKQDYHVSGHDVVFQNEATLSNVFLNTNSVHNIGKHPTGIELLPDTIETGEVWSWWSNAEKQQVVERAYIKANYIVHTIGGVVQEAMLLSSGSAMAWRKGCLLHTPE